MTKTIAMCVLALAGCTVAERDYTGPMISMQLTNNDDQEIEDTDSMPSFTLDDDDDQYSIDVEISTMQGESSDGDNTDSADVASVTASFQLGPMTLPTPSFTADGADFAPDYNSTAPIVIPASAKGGMLAITASGVDDNGIESNAIAFRVSLE
jgi:hypothetical protein